MWIARANRKRLLDLVTGSTSLGDLVINEHNNRNALTSTTPDEFYLAWKHSPSEKKYFSLPELVIVSNGTVQDFLAWAYTYVHSLRPFTAYIRVLEINRFNRIRGMDDKFCEVCRVDGVFHALLGLILGETISNFYKNNIRNLNSLSIRCAYSYVLAKALSANYDMETVAGICTSWVKAFRITNQQLRTLGFNETENICNTVLGALSNLNFSDSQMEGQLLLSAINEYIHEHKLSIETLHKLDMAHAITDQFYYLFHKNESRELMIKGLREYVNRVSLTSKNDSKDYDAFLIAYLASQASHGSLTYIDFLWPLLQRYNSIILWYCIFSALHPDSDIESFDNSFGWRILRDLRLRADYTQQPICDISIEELDVYISKGKPDFSFRTEISGMISVELFPSVDALFAWPEPEYLTNTNNISSSSTQLSIFENKNENLDNLKLAKIKGLLLTVTNMLNDLTPKNPRNYGDQFKSKKKKY